MIKNDIEKVINRGMTGDVEIKLTIMVKIANKALKYVFTFLRLFE